MVVLATVWFGTFLLEGEEIRRAVLFPKDARAIAERLATIQAGGILPEEQQAAEGVDDLQVADARLAPLGRVLTDPPVLADLHGKFGFDERLLRDASLLLGRKQIAAVPPDRAILQAVGAMDDLQKTENLLLERLREWYGLHFPEAARPEGVDPAKFLKAMAADPSRAAIAAALGIAGEPSGVELTAEDSRALQRFAESLLRLQEAGAALEHYLEQRVKEVAPNVAHVIGPVLGGRLLTLAGGLGRLGTLPSSTIQILGAEKAFFRHLAGEGGPPKHGVIFQHPLLHNSPPWQRGKIARAMAANVGMAAKCDLHTRRFLGPELLARLERRVQDIRRRFPLAPPPQASSTAPATGPRPFPSRGRHQQRRTDQQRPQQHGAAPRRQFRRRR